MKTLYIIRHAKSSWEDLSLDDYDRPLSKRGKEDIKLIGKQLLKKNIKIDKFYCSAAKRAVQTGKKLSKEIGYDSKKIIFDKHIYDYHKKGIDFYLSYIMDFKDFLNTIAIIGHNNVWSELVSYFIGKEVILQTSGVVKIDFDIKKWENISYGNGKIDYFIYPKMFKN